MAETSPTVRHRRLAAELRRLRENAGLSPEHAAAAIGWSRPKLVKIELAQSPLSVADVERILSAYGGEDSLKLALVQLARDIHKRGWWTAYGDVLSQSFAELEDAAYRIRSLQLEIVPGLLQTPDYARELIRSVTSDEEEIARRLEARRHRQTVLARHNAPALEVVLHEAVLRSQIGGPDVIREQLAELHLAATRPNISIRILPMSTGVRPGLGEGSFAIFDFPGPMAFGVVHLDSVAGSVYVEDLAQVERCNVVYDSNTDVCLSVEESAAFMAALNKE
jgi:transcriptional regulator with XRE-family HTH domain